MTKQRWKRHERQVAEVLGGQRLPCTGRPSPDVVTPVFAVECKVRARLPQWIHDAVDQARRSAGGGQTPIVVLTEARQGVKARRYVLMTLEDFADWHGRVI